MFDLGGYELLVILIIGLIVLGPEKLPKVVRMVSRAFRDFRRYTNDLKQDINEELVNGIREVRQELKEVGKDIQVPRVSVNDIIDPEEIIGKGEISYLEETVEDVKSEITQPDNLPEKTPDAPSKMLPSSSESEPKDSGETESATSFTESVKWIFISGSSAYRVSISVESTVNTDFLLINLTS